MAKYTYRLLFEYDGSAFSGFQRQSPEKGLLTIQDVLEEKLSMIFAQKIKTVVAGRTDAGVHALGQVVSFISDYERKPGALLYGLNSLLPAKIRILEASSTPARFHARFSAQGRCYQYIIAPHARREAFFSDYVLSYRLPLDYKRMNEAAALLLGSHDFSSFGSQVPKDEPHTRRLERLETLPYTMAVTNAQGQTCPQLPCAWRNFSDLLIVTIEANAFLRRMVRMLVACLLKVGSGEWDVQEPRRILEACDPQVCPPPAPAGGLYLVSVKYAQDWALETAKV